MGANAHAVFSVPRTPEYEAIILSALWKSLTGGDSLRGVSAHLRRVPKRYVNAHF